MIMVVMIMIIVMMVMKMIRMPVETILIIDIYTSDVNVNTGSNICDSNTMNLSCEGCRNETGKGSSSEENNSIIGLVD